jgi:hypothetical protein
MESADTYADNTLLLGFEKMFSFQEITYRYTKLTHYFQHVYVFRRFLREIVKA